MKKIQMLLRAAWRNQKASIVGIALLVAILSLCLFTSVTLYTSGEASVSAEMDRLGFGDLTVWVSGMETELKTELEALPDVESVKVQPLIFAGYELNGHYSDNEGQMIVADEATAYRLMTESGEHVPISAVAPGSVYLSPVLRESFGAKAGDTLHVELSRSGGNVELVVAGYFEDAFMGSSMIDMKSFLISPSDRDSMLQTIDSAADYDVLGKRGAMLHVFRKESSALRDTDFLQQLWDGTSLSRHTEFSYTRAAILRYMLLLQNILSGFLMAFSVVLLLVCMVVVSHSLSAAIEHSKRDIAIMKTIGLSGHSIRGAYELLYGGGFLLGIAAGLLPMLPVSRAIALGMVNSTGMLISVQPPALLIAVILGALFIGFTLFLFARTARILAVSPMQTIRQSGGGRVVKSPIRKRTLCADIALREVLSAKRKYVGICLIAALLTVFLSVIGRMGAWLGPNGEGLMNAFSVADHDLAVQPLNDTIDMDEIERVINGHSPITERYELAMQSVTVGGREYTANVLDDVGYFHVLEGTVCGENEALITYNVANEQGLAIGEEIQISGGGRRGTYTVSGIYQCANGMGANIGMSRDGYAKIGDVSRFIWCRHYLLENGNVRDAAMKFLQDNYRGIDVHTNAWSGLEGIVSLMRLLIGLIYAIAALFILIAAALIASKLLRSETYNLAIYRGIGLSAASLRRAFALRFLMAAAIGAVIGMLFSAAGADEIIGGIFRLFGIGAFRSRFSALGTLLPPLAVAALFFGFAWLFSAKIARISLAKLLSENDE